MIDKAYPRLKSIMTGKWYVVLMKRPRWSWETTGAWNVYGVSMGIRTSLSVRAA